MSANINSCAWELDFLIYNLESNILVPVQPVFKQQNNVQPVTMACNHEDKLNLFN